MLKVDESIIKINGSAVVINNLFITVLQLCEQFSITIPRFCYHELLSVAGNCRICMIEILNVPKPAIACATSLSKNMSIFTNSNLVRISRENVIEFLLINHPLDCPICDQGGECDLQDITMVFGSDTSRYKENKRTVIDKEFGPIIKTIMNRCIHCTRCVRFAEEVAGQPFIGTMGRGSATEISSIINSMFNSKISGNVVDLCPVGALTSKPYAFRARPWELTTTNSVDILDSLGSWIKIDSRGDEIVRILPVRNDSINTEWISDEIRFVYKAIQNNRILFCVYKHQNNSVLCSWAFAIQKFVYYYTLSINSVYPLSIVLGDLISYNDIKSLNYFAYYLTFNIFSISNYNINCNLRANWLINSTVNDLINTDNLFLINLSTKNKSPVFHSRLFNNIYNRTKKNVYFLGNYNYLDYKVNHIGYSIYKLINILNGNSYNSEIINYNTKLITDNNYNINSNCISYVMNDSGCINTLESGVLYNSNIFNELNSLIVFVGDHTKMNNNMLNSLYTIFMSHHINDILLNKSNLVMPTTCFNEEIGDWLNNQLIVFYNYQQSDTVPGDIMNITNILNIILNVLSGYNITCNEFIFNEYRNTYYNLLNYNKLYESFYFKLNINLRYSSKQNSYISSNLLK